MLRDEEEAQLNDLEVCLLEALDLAAGTDLRSPWLDEAAERLRAAAERVANGIRRGGDLPDAPDPDRTSARRVLLWIEGLAAGDREAPLLDALARQLERCRDTCRQARRRPPDEATADRLALLEVELESLARRGRVEAGEEAD